MSEHKPLPCPFCNAPAEVRTPHGVDNGDPYSYTVVVKTHDSECPLKPYYSSLYYKSEADAAAAWNKRTATGGQK